MAKCGRHLVAVLITVEVENLAVRRDDVVRKRVGPAIEAIDWFRTPTDAVAARVHLRCFDHQAPTTKDFVRQIVDRLVRHTERLRDTGLPHHLLRGARSNEEHGATGLDVMEVPRTGVPCGHPRHFAEIVSRLRHVLAWVVHQHHRSHPHSSLDHSLLIGTIQLQLQREFEAVPRRRSSIRAGHESLPVTPELRRTALSSASTLDSTVGDIRWRSDGAPVPWPRRHLG